MPDVSNDWNQVRYELDKSANFQALCNSPWYTDAVYEKFSDAEYARCHTTARGKLTGVPRRLKLAHPGKENSCAQRGIGRTARPAR